MMSTDPYFPFRPDVWWPDLFEPLSLPERTNTALDDYATAHNMTPSAVIRQALDAFLNPAA